MRKVLIFGSILLLILCISAGGYWIYSEMNKQDVAIENANNEINTKNDEIKKSADELAKAKQDIENYKLLVNEYKTKEEERSNPYFGWKTYESKQYGIKFKYPESFTVSENKTEKTLEVLAILEDKYGGSNLIRKNIVIFSSKPYFQSYDNVPMKLSSSDPKTVSIDGKSYKFIKHGMGDGGPGGFSASYFFVFQYNKNVAVSLANHASGNTEADCNDPEVIAAFYNDKAECENNNYMNPTSEYKTSKSANESAILLIQSIRPL